MIWFGEKFNRFHLSNFKIYVRVNSSVLSYKHINLHFTIHWCRLRFVFIFICGKVRQMKSQKMNIIFEFSFSFSSTVRPFLTSDENENKISSFHFHFHFVGPYQPQKWINHVLSFHLIFSNKNSYLFDYSKNWKWKLYMANFVWNENSTSPIQSYGKLYLDIAF